MCVYIHILSIYSLRWQLSQISVIRYACASIYIFSWCTPFASSRFTYLFSNMCVYVYKYVCLYCIFCQCSPFASSCLTCLCVSYVGDQVRVCIYIFCWRARFASTGFTCLRSNMCMNIYILLMYTCVWMYQLKKKKERVYGRTRFATAWWRSMGCLKLQIAFCKRAANYRALLWKDL